jgi:xylose isomerase
MVEHLNSFELELRFSAGIWFFSPFESRFHAKYQDDLDLERRLEIAAGLADYGLSGLEAHYPNEVNEENLELWQQFTRDTGIRLITVIPLLFHDREFEFGSLSSPLAGPRRTAVDRATRSFALAKEIDADFSVVWAGIDGYENPFGIDFPEMRRRFIDGLVEAMDAAPGVRVAFEPKPYEPRGRILSGLTPEGVLLGHQVEGLLQATENRKLLGEGHRLLCMNPEIGHVLMGFEDLPYALSWPLGEGARPRRNRRRRGGGPLPRRQAVRRTGRRPGDPRRLGQEAGRRRLERRRAQGLPHGVAQGATGRLDRLAGDVGSAWRA